MNLWTHLVTMLFCQFSKSNSLRDIQYGLNSVTSNLNHYGVLRSPGKSSLFYFQTHREWKLFRDFYSTVAQNMKLSGVTKGD